MKPQRFVITQTVAGAVRSTLWESSKPCSLGHPLKWVLERTEDGIHVRDLSPSSPAFALRTLATNEQNSGQEIELAPGIHLNLKPVIELAPAYSTHTQGTDELRIYACRGTWNQSAEKIGGTYTAYNEGKKAFKVEHSNKEYRLKSLVDGVIVNDRALKRDETIGLPFKNASDEAIRIQADQMQWRLERVQSSSASTIAALSVAGFDSEVAPFKRSLKTAASLAAAFIAVALFWPKAQTPDTATQAVRLVFRKPVTPKTASAVAASASPAQPKTIAKPKAVAHQSVTRKPVLAQNSHSRKVTHHAAASSSHSLEKAAQGLLKSSSPNLLAKSRWTSDSVFDSHSSHPHAASPEGGTLGLRQVKVASLGGASGLFGAKTLGYANDVHAHVHGQGRSWVSLDTTGADVEEGLTKDQVGAVIHQHLSEVRYCYESAVLRSPETEGKLAINFVINGGGRVKVAGVKTSSLLDEHLDECVTGRLKTWAFPHPRGGVDVAVNYPFIFKTLGR